ncbi:formamidase [Sugiyamaella lignohabitans]|uniref:Formamidase n=1 Tax=Sugiyamaella lignohabitans TaxID=796027 RepID=A0A161HGH6_9ASCO|nr:formamidase [Sugiyamaella lignohabitans]ANB11901.1 formamidase [Sugiyamaella lignohabitans]
MTGELDQSFHVHSGQSHLKWSKDIKPVLRVKSGEVVTFDANDSSNNQIHKDSTLETLYFDLAICDPVYGPVYIEGAEPGDTLEVELMKLDPADWGWTAIFPDFGLLADEFPDTQLKIWKFAKGSKTAEFKKGIEVPIRPFLGEVGVAPPEGEHSTIPPLDTGGNIDCRHVVEGTKLYLPVKVAGALFSCGDGHAAQGDGEVCGTAIETPMTATLRFTVHKDKPWVTSPHYLTKPITTTVPDKGTYSILGIDSDLREAARKAIRSMIVYLTTTHSLTKVEAYMLCSVAVDLKIAEAVDMPNYAVAATLPLNIFTE